MAEADNLDTLTTAHSAVGYLPALLEKLRRLDRLNIGTERAQHAAALLRRLHADGIELKDVDDAAAWLGPVLCVTARDRRALRERLRREADATRESSPPQRRELGPLPLAEAEAEARRSVRRPWRRGVFVSAAVLAALVSAVFAPQFGGGGEFVGAAPPIAGIEGSIQWGNLAVELALLGMALLALGVLVARRLLAAAPPAELHEMVLRPTGQGLAWFDEGTLQAPLRLMGALRRGAGQLLDLPETIRRTVGQAGWPILVRGSRPRAPEHVMLVEISDVEDPCLLAASALLDRLRGADLRVTAYVCAGGFKTPRHWSGGPTVPLARVAALHRDARLLLVSDGGTLHNAFVDRLDPPAEFDAFAIPVLVTPLPRERWGWREATFDRAGWRLAELSTDGLADLARWLSGPREAPPPLVQAANGPPSFATLLERDHRLFQEDSGLPLDLRERLRDRLEQHLGGDPQQGAAAFDLLRVLAMGASLAPATVERVAAHLASLDGPRAEETALRRLIELPWFAHGRMPVWLREDLRRDMPGDLARKGRDAWLLHFAGQQIGAGALGPEQIPRLTAEARRAVAGSLFADASMLRALALDAPPRGWRDRLNEGLLALVFAGGAALGLWALVALAPAIREIGDEIFAPFDFAIQARWPWLGLIAMVIAAAPLVPHWQGRRAGGPALAAALSSVALLLAVAPIWLIVSSMVRDGLVSDNLPDRLAYPIYASTLLAIIGLIALRIVVPLRPPAPAPLTALLARGNPWATFVLFVGLLIAWIGMLWSASQGPDSLYKILTLESVTHIGVALFALASYVRLRAHGLYDRNLLFRAVIAFVAGQAVASVPFVMGRLFADTTSFVPFLPFVAPDLLLRVLGGSVAAAHVLGLALSARRLSIVAAFVGVVAALTASADWIDKVLGINSEYVSVAGFLLPLPLIATWLLFRPPQAHRQWKFLAWIAAFTLGPIAIFALIESDKPFWALDSIIGLTIAFPVLCYTLLQPMLKSIYPEYFPPSDGLWRRCLLLIPCWFGVAVQDLSIGLMPACAIPISAWIAHRHGPRALPAISLALAPMVISGRIELAGVGWLVGDGLGYVMAALVVARFVADRPFREECLAATTLKRWQLVVIALLPIAYSTPNIENLRLASALWPLAVTVAALIGVSRIPLRGPLVALGVSTLIGLSTFLLAGPLLPRELGWLSHGMSDVPEDLFTSILALGVFRLLRGQNVEAPIGWLIGLLRDRPRAFAIATIAGAMMFRVFYDFSPLLDASWELRTSLTPFILVHVFLVVFYLGATGVEMSRYRALRIPGLTRLPWPVASACFGAFVVAVSPTSRFGSDQLGVILFPGGISTGIYAIIGIWLFHRLGQGLAGLVPIESANGDGGGPTRIGFVAREHPVFATKPLRVVIVLLGLIALGAAAGLTYRVVNALDISSAASATLSQRLKSP